MRGYVRPAGALPIGLRYADDRAQDKNPGGRRRSAPARSAAALSDRAGVRRARGSGCAGHGQAARARARRSARARPDAPGRGRPVDLPAAARREEHGPHHHADREGRGRGPHRRPGDGRRRLPAQALQPARAGRAHQRGAAPPRGAASSGGARGRAGKGQLREHDGQPRDAHARARRTVDVAHYRRIRAAQGPGDQPEDAAVARQTDGARARPRVRGVRPLDRRPGLAPPAARPVLNLALELARQQLGEGTRFAGERDGKPGLWLSFHIDDDEYWLRIPRERIERQIALRWLGWGALALVLSLLAAYFLVSRLNRPLRALAEGAGAIGKGKMPDPVPESGPEEIRTLSHAFNQMSRDLARLDADRALILAGVSHDLRTPLSRLRLGLEMSGADPQLREGMTADIEEMDRTINQFLDFARTDGGEPVQSADLAAIAAEVAEHYLRRGKSIATDFSAVPELPLQLMSMRRVVMNLIDNALRYGEKEVSVAVRAEDRAVALEVADRGPGIPESEAERLKQPFTRLEVARSDKGGAGLGLAIVERVVRAHRGSFELLAREGGGLVARIRLPS